MLEIIIGFISGTVSGMGMGGGTLLIPALVILMEIEQKLHKVSICCIFCLHLFQR